MKMRNYLFILLLLLAACHKNNTGGEALGATIGLSPNVGLAGTVMTITGKGFGADTGAIHVSFNGVRAIVQIAADTQLLVTVPNGTTGPVIVSKGSQMVTGPYYTYQNMAITAISPTGGPAGITDTITGTGLNFSGKIESELPAVYFNGKSARVVSADTNHLIVIVPDTPGLGPVSVALASLKVTGPIFNYVGIASVTPLTGNVGTVITINGGFGTGYASATVTIGGKAASIKSSSQAQLLATASTGDTTGPVVVHLSNGQTLSGPVFTFVPPPTVTSLLPSSGPAGTIVTITGTSFNSFLAQDIVTFNGTPATVTQASPTQLTVTVPAGATSGPVKVDVNDQIGAGPVYTVQPLGILSVNPPAGPPGTVVTITGTGFNPVAAQDLVAFNGTPGTVTSATATQLVVTVPNGFTPGPLTVATGGLTATGPIFRSLTPGVYTIAGGTLNPGQFSSPVGLAIDASGNVYVADNGSNNIQEISTSGTVTTFAIGLSGPTDLVFDKQGNLYVADQSVIRMITPAGTMSTFAPMPSGDRAWGISIDASGNIYVADQSSNAVDEFSSGGSLLSSTRYGPGSLYGVAVDASGNIYTCYYGPGETNENNTPVIQNGSFGPQGVAVDNSGNAIVADNYASEIYSPAPGNVSTPIVITGGSGSGYQDGPLGSARFRSPVGVKVDGNGYIYVADQGNNAIRKIVLQ